MAGQAEVNVSVADLPQVLALIRAARLVLRDLVRAYPVAPDGLCEVCQFPVRDGHARGCSVGLLATALEPFRDHRSTGEEG